MDEHTWFFQLLYFCTGIFSYSDNKDKITLQATMISVGLWEPGWPPVFLYSETCPCDYLYSDTTSIQRPLGLVPKVPIPYIQPLLRDHLHFFLGPDVVA
jgi:hypothetical protein